jgi:hypothetical protein
MQKTEEEDVFRRVGNELADNSYARLRNGGLQQEKGLLASAWIVQERHYNLLSIVKIGK